MAPPECNVLVQLVAEVKRLDEAIKVNFERIVGKLQDHVDYTKQRFDSEMKRISDVRGIDEGNRTTASAAATETAAGLAKQLVNTETSGRALVASTAEAAAKRQESFAVHVETRMGEQDKAINKSEGSKGGMRDLAGWIFGAIMALIAIGGLIAAFLK